MNHSSTSKNADPSRAEVVFTAALEHAPQERAAIAEKLCENDSALLAEVRRLLEAYEQAGDFMPAEIPRSTALGAQMARFKSEEPGERIGNYKLLQEIGKGGFGVVWMAEQEAPVRRRVALKILKLGMDTREVVARFEQERQALAMMDHPNIAKVLDAGCTATGRPFFVMELVRGIKITDYCDENQLSPEERLKLCVQVCQAVQHAHQKGIIHRDLKPSNILVTVHDGVPVPKVIDFGVAKATQQRLTDLTFFTEFRQMIGTPLYMSPEQAEMSASLDIDTRSDIYSLGVLLYELLTGHTPFPAEELMRAGLDEIRRVIREEEPRRPSAALAALSEPVLTTTAERRSSQPPHLIKLMRGDLDWVVMKALEKDRRRRYETAEALAADLLHHLHNEPVNARPPTPFYRFRKMVRRHRTATIATTAVVVALLVTLAAMTAGYLRVRAVVNELNEAYFASNRAASEQARQADAATSARQEERERSREFDASQRFFHEFIRTAAHDGGETARLRAAVDEAVSRMAPELAERRLVEASLRHTIGTVYWQLGHLEKSNSMLLAAKELRCGYLPGSHPGELPIVAQSLYSLAVVRIGLGKTDEGKTLLLEALSLRDPKFRDNGMSPDDPLVVDLLHALALLAIDGRAMVEANARGGEALALARRLEPDGGWMTVRSLRLLADVFQQMGDANAATPLRAEADAMALHLPADTTRAALPHPKRLATPE